MSLSRPAVRSERDALMPDSPILQILVKYIVAIVEIIFIVTVMLVQ